jgi:hypothetical protein
MLCGLAASVFATYVAPAATILRDSSADPEHGGFHRSWRVRRDQLAAWLALAGGFALTSWWIQSGRPVDAAWVGGPVAVLSAAQLVRPSHPAYLTAASGALAGLWASLILAQGLPQPFAIASGAALPVASGFLSMRTPVFAPPLLQEEALIAILALAVVVAVSPTIAQGWQAALALNLVDRGASMPLVPVSMVSFVGASTLLGALWSLWRRG